MISIRMFKISGDAIIESLFKIFKNCFKCGIFLDDWKQRNTAQIFKKRDKQNIVQSLFFQSATRFSNVSHTITC